MKLIIIFFRRVMSDASTVWLSDTIVLFSHVIRIFGFNLLLVLSKGKLFSHLYQLVVLSCCKNPEKFENHMQFLILSLSRYDKI